MPDSTRSRDDASLWTARGRAVVCAAHHEAAAAGREILAAGGNAVDAAVAVSAALGVCEPAGSGLGGMTTMLIHLRASGSTLVLENPCRAPLGADPRALLGKPRRSGYDAAAVPTTPATLAYALERWGTMPPRDVLAPALRLARDGFTVTPLLHRLIVEYGKALGAHSGGAVFLPGGAPPAAGAVLRQPALAAALERLGEAGFEDFYTGDIAAAIAADMRANGGLIAAEDLARVPFPTPVEPLRGRLGAWDVCTPPPPAGGTALLQMLALVDAAAGLDLRRVDDLVLLAGIIRRARSDRRRFRYGMPAGPGGKPRLLDAAYARKALSEVRARLAAGETTHANVVDAAGNAVALTQSIERCFGSKCLTPRLGFLYNGYMRAFKLQDERHPHFLRPGAVARSNACPTLLFERGRLRGAVGSTGSERLASGIAATLLRLAAGETPFAAVAAPRLHATPEGVVLLEAARFPDELPPRLRDAGFLPEDAGAHSFKMGGLQLAWAEGEAWTAVGEPRRDGGAYAA